jgi:hypothetical protein
MEYEYWDIDLGEVRITTDPTDLVRANKRLMAENRRLYDIVHGTILVVEDGSVDIDKLEEDGFYVIPYRQGSALPKVLPTDKNV